MNQRSLVNQAMFVVAALALVLVIFTQYATQRQNDDLVEQIGGLQDVIVELQDANASLAESLIVVQELLEFNQMRAQRADCISELTRRWFVAIAANSGAEGGDPAVIEAAQAEFEAATDALIAAAETCEAGS